MGAIGFEALAALLILLPGFLAARTVQSLCVRPSQTELDKVVEALLYSFVIYVAFVAIIRRSPIEILERTLPDGSRAYSAYARSWDLLLLLGLGLVLGWVISGSVTNDLHGKLFRLLRLTNRTTRSSIWGDVFDEMNFYIQIQFCDGRKLIGWPRYFSDTPEEASLFLEKAAWIDDDGEMQEVPGPGILITRNMPIETIMFLKGELVAPKSDTSA